MLQDDEELLNHQPLEEAHNAYKNHSPYRCKREAQLSPSDRAMRLVASNLLVFLIN